MKSLRGIDCCMSLSRSWLYLCSRRNKASITFRDLVEFRPYFSISRFSKLTLWVGLSLRCLPVTYLCEAGPCPLTVFIESSKGTAASLTNIEHRALVALYLIYNITGQFLRLAILEGKATAKSRIIMKDSDLSSTAPKFSQTRVQNRLYFLAGFP